MAIIDLPTYKAYKNITSTADDTKHTLIIDAVNAFIEAYTGRVFTTYYNTDKTEYYDSRDIQIYPLEYPLVSITSLDYSTDGGQNYGNALAEFTDYTIISNESILSLSGGFADVAIPANAVRLVYKGGYEKIPKDLEFAAVHLTEYYKDEEYIPRKSMSGVSVDTVIQPDMTFRLPAHIRRVLESYRNIVM
jgi:hypothetical protein